MSHLWCNGRWIEADNFRIAATDRGLLHGLGLFETILAVDGRPVFADRHLARLRHGGGRFGWNIDTDGLEEIMGELLDVNGVMRGRARIRLAVTGGSGVLSDCRSGDDYLGWMMALRAPAPPATIAVNRCPFPRNERSPLAGLKCASYAENLLALDRAARLGFDETLFLNTSGHLCEAAAANLFMVIGDKLFTPALDCGCLPGITRAVIIDLAEQLGISCEEDAYPAETLAAADEIFLTSSLFGVIEVSRFEEWNLEPGGLTVKLRAAWHKAVHHDP